MGAAKKSTIVSLREALFELNRAWKNDPTKTGRSIIAQKTIYNAISAKKIRRHGPKHFVQVELEQILDLYGPKKAS